MKWCTFAIKRLFVFANLVFGVKSIFRKYIKEYRQLFYTFNEIMLQTFDKTKYGSTMFTNIEIIM